MAVVANQALAFDKSMLVALSPSRRCAPSGIDPRSRKNQKFLSSERRPTLGYRPAVAFGVSGAGGVAGTEILQEFFGFEHLVSSVVL
jgi:hypothetical protein